MIISDLFYYMFVFFSFFIISCLSNFLEGKGRKGYVKFVRKNCFNWMKDGIKGIVSKLHQNSIWLEKVSFSLKQSEA
jgi:hypothetical protein